MGTVGSARMRCVVDRELEVSEGLREMLADVEEIGVETVSVVGVKMAFTAEISSSSSDRRRGSDDGTSDASIWESIGLSFVLATS